MDKEKQNILEPDFGKANGKESIRERYSVMLFPLLISVYFMAGFTQINPENIKTYATEQSTLFTDNNSKKNLKLNFAALLANEQFSLNLRDTVYTDKDLYLEVRIDKQMLYVHYRNGKVKEYPISTGIPGAHKSVESRPGLFAIFMKEELHLSSQFNDAKMFYYMPYNMGIGFHGLAGTGYYGNLGIRPSSHGCIRMRTPDAKELFRECSIGTLVLSHRGKSARVIAFAPEGYVNEKEYTEEEYKEMLAYNLKSIYEGKYFVHTPKRFVINPSVIPKIGINVGTTDDIPAKQDLPVLFNRVEQKSDRLESALPVAENIKEKLEEDIAVSFQFGAEEEAGYSSLGLGIGKEHIDKFVYNRIGILPYFPPEIKSSSGSNEQNESDAPTESDTPVNDNSPSEGE